MQDASSIIFLVILGNALLLGSAAVRYMCTEGAPLAVKHRLWINFVSYLLMVLLVSWALRHGYNHRQLWVSGSYEFTAQIFMHANNTDWGAIIVGIVTILLPNAFMFGFWAGNGRVIYTSIAFFMVWHILMGMVGYLISPGLWH